MLVGEPNRPLGLLRVGLRLAQVMGATVALYFLATTGVSNPTLWATTATVFFLILSRLIFARRDHDGRTDGG
jgi:hypothetical protein